ncbi:MAG: hypothetical protein ABSA83_07655 [Verrucomicrobiota bacterium]|jgi:hypothetical protein
MTDQKCGEVRRHLEALLSRFGYGWVVSAVEEQIRFGKTEILVVDAIEEGQISLPSASSPVRATRRARKDKFLRRVDYTPRDHLKLTIDALEYAVVDVGEIGIHLNDFISRRNLYPSEVKFAPEAEGVAPRASTIHSMPSRREHLARLRSLLADLRKEVGEYGS